MLMVLMFVVGTFLAHSGSGFIFFRVCVFVFQGSIDGISTIYLYVTLMVTTLWWESKNICWVDKGSIDWSSSHTPTTFIHTPTPTKPNHHQPSSNTSKHITKHIKQAFIQPHPFEQRNPPSTPPHRRPFPTSPWSPPSWQARSPLN